MDPARYAHKYRTELLERVIPFWMRHSIDREYGGYFTCLDRQGNVYDTRKYVWLNGRQAWMLSKLYNEVDPKAEWIEAARLGVDFLRKHARDEQGRVYFSLTREGEPSGYQRKPYAAVFMMLGLLEYAKAARDGVIYREAVELYWRVAEWIESPGKLGRPVLAGAPEYSQLADIYVAAFMSLELASYDPDPRFRGIMVECLELAERHYDPERRILRENLGPTEFPEGRLFSAGSSLEVAWILLRLLDYHPDERRKKWILEAIEGSLDWGWDHEYGGLYYFQDVESKPLLQLEGSMKLWWVHVEALVAVVHAYKISGEDRWLEWLEILDTYCWRHFRDSEYGEWFGYLDRRGERTHSLKGNNYKGCFHVPRGMLLCSQMLES